MSGGIYLIQSNGELLEMTEQGYDSEDMLQTLLAKYPNLLAGSQMNPDDPRRWLLVTREAALPAEEGAGGRWSVDHLFLDQDAIPTLVEVKRSADTRIRREVVGQMLDYAANAVLYWPVERIRAQFETRCERDDLDTDEVLAGFLGEESESELFWQKVKTNLQAGRVRMVFVADQIPPELQRIVEFLNEQMDPAEVLAVEIKQFAAQQLKTLVPRVIGQTAEAQQKKPGSADKKRWDEGAFFSTLDTRPDAYEAQIARSVMTWAKNNSLRIWWGRGARDGSFFVVLDHQQVSHHVIAVWTGVKRGYFQTQFGMMKTQPPFDADSLREELRKRLNSIPGVSIPSDAISKYPSIPLAVLKETSVLRQFLGVLDWVVQQIRAS